MVPHDVDGLPNVRAVPALGRIAHDGVLKLWHDRGLRTTLAAHPFAHDAVHRLESPPGANDARVVPLIASFHVCRQNTQTGRLITLVFDAALATALDLAHTNSRPEGRH